MSNKELSLIQDDVRHKWLSIAEGVYFAFQPIVNIYTGAAYGVEALLRGYQEQGFESIFALIDEAYQDQALYTLDLSLRRKALEQFCQHPLSRHGRLFYNLDNRTLEMPDYSTGNTHAILDALNLDKHSLCFEISERHQFQDISKVQQILNQYESEGLSISIDDFGTGYSGLQLLYQADPEIIKIDRFFISAINQDIKKKMFISKIVKLAHLMGIKVIAEGVETEEEYYHCKNIGCDLLQGYFVARPLGSIQEVQMHYLHVHKLAKKEKRMSRDNQSALEKHIDHIKPVDRDGSLLQLLKHFRLDKDLDFIPVLDQQHSPQGIIREKDLKEYVYSPYGISLLVNKSHTHKLHDFIVPVPLAEAGENLENILELFSGAESAPCVIITKKGEYYGVLTASCLLRLLNERELTAARDQNPLTKLPGNAPIEEYLSKLFQKGKGSIVYFDLNNFKPFNDAFGFRLGDRILLLMADILRSVSEDFFVGHIGGDDFIIAAKSYCSRGELEKVIMGIQAQFSRAVTGFFPEKQRHQGSFQSMDREGELKSYPLTAVSAAGICMNHLPEGFNKDSLSLILAELKKQAKSNASHIALKAILGSEEE